MSEQRLDQETALMADREYEAYRKTMVQGWKCLRGEHESDGMLNVDLVWIGQAMKACKHCRSLYVERG